MLKKSSIQIMGIVNLTKDSFYADSRAESVCHAVDIALAMEAEGADILDLGAESTRPGSDYVSAQDELTRIIPVLTRLRGQTKLPISIDTRKAEVAQVAIAEGADMINDVSGLQSPELAVLLANASLPLVIMHMRGQPKTMQNNPFYADPLKEVTMELMESVKRAKQLGIKDNNIIIDPGIGFGKRLSDNLCLLRSISALKETGYRVLIGASRKSFIGQLLTAHNLGEHRPEDNLPGSLAVVAWAVWQGVDILRVHDVRATKEVCVMIEELRGPAH